MLESSVIIVIMLSMFITLLRCVASKTTYDRILAANVFGTITVAFIALLGFFKGQMVYLDIALIYAFINFISTVALLKYFKDRSFR